MKIKKRSFTAVLVVVLLFTISTSLVSAKGTEREFWAMTIRASKGESVLTTRSKETNNEYSRVKVTSLVSIGKVTVGFKGPTYYLGSTVIDNGGSDMNKWKTVYYTTNSGGINAPAALFNRNYNQSLSTGSMAGWVDYE